MDKNHEGKIKYFEFRKSNFLNKYVNLYLWYVYVLFEPFPEKYVFSTGTNIKKNLFLKNSKQFRNEFFFK